jgi:hypothetical protein
MLISEAIKNLKNISQISEIEKIQINYNNPFEKIVMKTFSSLRSKRKFYKYTLADTISNEIGFEFYDKNKLSFSEYKEGIKFKVDFKNPYSYEVRDLFEVISNFEKIYMILENEIYNIKDILLSEDAKEFYIYCKNEKQNKVIKFENLKCYFILR